MCCSSFQIEPTAATPLALCLLCHCQSLNQEDNDLTMLWLLQEPAAHAVLHSAVAHRVLPNFYKER